MNLNDKIKLIQEAITDVTPADLTIYLRSIYIYEQKRKDCNKKKLAHPTSILFQNKQSNKFTQKKRK